MEEASHGGQYPTIHYQEQPLDGNLHLLTWNSSIKRPQRAGTPRVGCTVCTVLEEAPLLDLRVWRKGCKKMDKKRKTMLMFSRGLHSMSADLTGGLGRRDYKGSALRQLRKMELSQAPWHIHIRLSINRLRCKADRWKQTG